MSNNIVLMIVDDEEIIRRGVISQLDWESIGVAEVIEAENAEKAMALIKDRRPDIVITDIRMPRIDGIQLAKMIYEYDKDIKIIMLSGYDDFSYVQQAIRYGVVEYLLKPASKQKLSETIEKTVELIKQNRLAMSREHELKQMLKNNRSVLLERLFNRLIYSRSVGAEPLQKECEFLGIDTAGKQVTAVVYEHDEISALGEWAESGMINLLKYGMINVLEEIFPDGSIVFENMFENITIFYTEEIGGNKGVNTAELVKNSIFALEKCFNIKFYAGIGSCVGSLIDVKKTYDEAVFALNNRQCVDNSVVQIGDVCSSEEVAFVYPKELEEDILNRILMGSSNDLENDVNAFLDYMLKYRFCTAEFFKSICCGIYMSMETKLRQCSFNPTEIMPEREGFFRQIHDCADTEEVTKVMKNLFSELQNYFKEFMKFKNHDSVMLAKKFMKENLQHNLSLTEIAAKVNLSPNYFSGLFKEETGETLMSYFTKLRMEKAKELLLTTKMRIYEVANAVGYSDQRYFSQVFKKNAGMLPNEYQLNNNGKK